MGSCCCMRGYSRWWRVMAEWKDIQLINLLRLVSGICTSGIFAQFIFPVLLSRQCFKASTVPTSRSYLDQQDHHRFVAQLDEC